MNHNFIRGSRCAEEEILRAAERDSDVSSINPREPKWRPQEDQRAHEREQLKPRPIGDRCNPLCPFFRCQKRALRIATEQYKGRPIRVAMCAWIGDKCIGASCRFAYCDKRAMLPDGRCALAVKSKKAKDFEEELMELEKDYDFDEGL